MTTQDENMHRLFLGAHLRVRPYFSSVILSAGKIPAGYYRLKLTQPGKNWRPHVIP
jgi:hypothetical protein